MRICVCMHTKIQIFVSKDTHTHAELGLLKYLMRLRLHVFVLVPARNPLRESQGAQAPRERGGASALEGVNLLYLGSEIDVTSPINQRLDHVRVKPFPRRGEDRRYSILGELYVNIHKAS